MTIPQEHINYVKAIQMLRPNSSFSLSSDNKNLDWMDNNTVPPTYEEIEIKISEIKNSVPIYSIPNYLIVDRLNKLNLFKSMYLELKKDPFIYSKFYLNKSTESNDKTIIDILIKIGANPNEILSLGDNNV